MTGDPLQPRPAGVRCDPTADVQKAGGRCSDIFIFTKNYAQPSMYRILYEHTNRVVALQE